MRQITYRQIGASMFMALGLLVADVCYGCGNIMENGSKCGIVADNSLQQSKAENSGYPGTANYGRKNAKKVAARRRDAERIKTKITYDLAFNDLHGPVHTLITPHEKWTYNKKGKIIRLNGYNPFTVDIYADPNKPIRRLVRDKSGKIAEEAGWDIYTKYDWRGYRLVKEEWDYEGHRGVSTFVYNQQGLCISIKGMEVELDEVPTYSTTKISYTKFDEYGNWIERKVGGDRQKRTITYYKLSELK